MRCIRRILPPHALITLLSLASTTNSRHHSSSGAAVPSINVNELFYYTASRNQRVITQAVDFVVSMQTAPTCTRMAASHLMNECKLLENAPEFAKARPEAYLDNVKTEYAAKLAVCELLSAQPSNATPPPNCEILVPSSRACSRGSVWWYSRPDVAINDKQCYPELKEYQYAQCLKTLQSSPQYWTSFSNARQNAVVMCQASRDAIERETHLETFKNLTQVMGSVSSAMEKSAKEYEVLVKGQKQFADEVREAQDLFKEKVEAVQEKALATVGTLDDKFQKFMEGSMSELIRALSENKSNEINRVHQEMQAFSRDLKMESSQFAAFFNNQLQEHHDYALKSLKVNHEAQMHSYDTLSNRLGGLHDTADMVNMAANSSLYAVVSIEQRLENLSDQADHIAQGFAFFSALPTLLAILCRGIIATVGILFLFGMLYKANTRFALYVAGACSSAYLFHLCGLYPWLGNLPIYTKKAQEHTWISSIADMSSSQKAASIVMMLWLAAYPVGCVNAYLGSVIGNALNSMLEPYWVRQHGGDGGFALLPSIEIPSPVANGKPSYHDNTCGDTHPPV
ncbi:hypothetical protein GQ44DRAFT_616671 [Phaeosphaeriaceae sp. PMI808]|nr:hypothetical protein GQ44DRAFT_616671 [Phaeosphaeriaceae sp. PMI808]